MKLNWRQRDKWNWEGYSDGGMIVCSVADFNNNTARLYRKEPDQEQFDFISSEHARAWADKWYGVYVHE